MVCYGNAATTEPFKFESQLRGQGEFLVLLSNVVVAYAVRAINRHYLNK